VIDMYGNVTSPSDAIKPLSKVFDLFIKNLTRYAEENSWGNLPHYYNERATLSIFSAACWQAGLIALEEYATTKGRGQGKRNGRCDLWVSSDVTSWGFEAKQYFPVLGVKDTTLQKVLGNAADAASHNYDSDLHAGLTFFTPSVPKGTSSEEVEALLQRMLTVAIRRGCHGAAWWFPENLMHQPSPLRKDRTIKHIWPGLLVIVEIIRPQKIKKITESSISILKPPPSGIVRSR